MLVIPVTSTLRAELRSDAASWTSRKRAEESVDDCGSRATTPERNRRFGSHSDARPTSQACRRFTTRSFSTENSTSSQSIGQAAQRFIARPWDLSAASRRCELTTSEAPRYFDSELGCHDPEGTKALDRGPRRAVLPAFL